MIAIERYITLELRVIGAEGGEILGELRQLLARGLLRELRGQLLVNVRQRHDLNIIN